VKPRTIVDVATGKVTRTQLIPHTPCGKNGYTTRKIAAAVAKRASKETGDTIEAYRCKRGCHCWHIGHPPGYSLTRHREQQTMQREAS
jgi:hypothetical protein